MTTQAIGLPMVREESTMSEEVSCLGDMGSGVDITKRPMAEGEVTDSVLRSFRSLTSKEEEVAGDGITKTKDEVVAEAGSEERNRKSQEMIGDGDMRIRVEGEVLQFFLSLGDLGTKTRAELKAMIRSGRLEEGNKYVVAGDGKRKRVVRYEKEYIEMKMRRPPPTPYPRMSDKTIERRERPECPGRVRAMEDELTALAQKQIDRDAEMRRQYALQGYADLELTEDELSDDDEDDTRDWRPWVVLKALGLVDK